MTEATWFGLVIMAIESILQLTDALDATGIGLINALELVVGEYPNGEAFFSSPAYIWYVAPSSPQAPAHHFPEQKSGNVRL